ncbi:hypothetical protein [Hymenobacter sp. IS2118]|uniref:hypothetical protein n=1 Tax=Hymenobacter sp. IS2118 TaxID=1505605 RepID=UPI000551A39A|nr:hypothetical protein [Hymenobacter sp. IS2118]
MSEPPSDSLPDKNHRKGGRKPGPVANKQRHVISVRLTDAEYLRLMGETAKYKLSQGEVLRAVWLNQHSITKLSVPPTVERAKQRVQLVGMANDLQALLKRGGHGEDTNKVLLSLVAQLTLMLA